MVLARTGWLFVAPGVEYTIRRARTGSIDSLMTIIAVQAVTIRTVERIPISSTSLTAVVIALRTAPRPLSSREKLRYTPTNVAVSFTNGAECNRSTAATWKRQTNLPVSFEPLNYCESCQMAEEVQGREGKRRKENEREEKRRDQAL